MHQSLAQKLQISRQIKRSHSKTNGLFIDKLSLPLMKDNDELGLALVLGEIRASREVEEFCWNSANPWAAFDWADESSPTTLTLRLNIWTVPLSLDTANHWTFGERAILYISALFPPLRTYMQAVNDNKQALTIRKTIKSEHWIWHAYQNLCRLKDASEYL